MDPFELPEEMPTDLAGLADLRAQAEESFNDLRDIVNSGEDLTEAQLEQLRSLAQSITAIDTAAQDIEQAEHDRRAEAADLISQVAGQSGENEDEGEGDDTDNEEGDGDTEGDDDVSQDDVDAVVTEAEQAAADAADTVAASGRRRTNFSRAAGRKPNLPAARRKPDIGWRMDTNVFGFKPGKVGFADLAEAVESVRPGQRMRSSRPVRGGFSGQTLGRLDREMPLIETSHELVAAIETATNEKNLPGGSLTAAGGWCAPSEQLYDFCEVPQATDLVSLPEIAIKRGGIRWPVEPDLSAIFDSFQFFFTEPQLEAVDAEGNPTAIKECVEVPCPEEFEELRLNAVGYCVEAGILQNQGWPELIEWFMRSLTQEHFRALSRRTVLDMVAGSTGVTIPADAQIAAGSSVLNSLALMATNLRLDRGLGRTATIEGVAPSWLFEVIRADLANQEGTDTKAVTDAQVTSWLTARNIALQFVGDWQTRGTGQPGNLQTVVYPGTVNVLLYPAGTWFRSLSNVLELGVMYPKEQLQVNRYTRFFTEDAIAVGKRCNQSLNVTIPICPSGAIGARQTIACNTPDPVTP
ncbi:major capsid protein [Rhodococcus rhodochrous]|uniref:major capsid protein n=1 Tax=Rhodococcus rhodochrous TaxID=1829 RepID=UPI000376A089|nr:major capsid protein [Rhodococcus rhodochrous]